MKVMLIYSSQVRQTAKIAKRIESQLKKADCRVMLVEAEDTEEKWIVPDAFDGIIVGTPFYQGKLQQDAVQFVTKHASELKRHPTAFFSVSLSAASRNKQQIDELENSVSELIEQSGWTPDLKANFAGALYYTRYGLFKRWLAKRVAAKAGGDTDTTHDYEYTDWDQVAEFVRHFKDIVAARLDTGKEAANGTPH